MVKIEEPSDYDRLDALVQRLTKAHGLKLDVNGWARKTYDVYTTSADLGPETKVARLDSHTTVSGELTLFDDEGLAFVQELGAEIEKQFAVAEARIKRQ